MAYGRHKHAPVTSTTMLDGALRTVIKCATCSQRFILHRGPREYQCRICGRILAVGAKCDRCPPGATGPGMDGDGI